MTKLHPVEKDVKAKIKKILAGHGWKWWSPSASAFGQSGVSDILALKGSCFVAIEVKLDKPSGSDLQEDWMQDVRDHGGFAKLINAANLDTLAPWLYEISDYYGRYIDSPLKGQRYVKRKPAARE